MRLQTVTNKIGCGSSEKMDCLPLFSTKKCYLIGCFVLLNLFSKNETVTVLLFQCKSTWTVLLGKFNFIFGRVKLSL